MVGLLIKDGECFILLYTATPDSRRLGVLYFAALFCKFWSLLYIVIQRPRPSDLY